ncbi:MAG: hypothetical protein WCF26_01065 [Candidatus Sulfotelmatobacter sp.]
MAAAVAGWCGAAVVLFAVSLSWTQAGAQESTTAQISPAELVRETVANEVAANNNPAIKHMFRSRKQTPRGTQTHLYVETNDAMAGILIAQNDHPLSPEQEQAENDHLAWLMNNPEQLRKKRAREKEDADRTLRMVKALPNAFRYQYAGTQAGEQSLGKVGDELVRLNFTPNPAYSPPSREQQVFTGMQGYLLIDINEKRIAKIDGTLFREVSFGWGIFGHLDKGGYFRVQQADVGQGAWELTAMDLKMTGKILLFKSFSMISNEVLTDFQRVPEDLPFAKGVELLKTEREKLASASASKPTSTGKVPQTGAPQRREQPGVTLASAYARSVSFRTVNFSIKSVLTR